MTNSKNYIVLNDYMNDIDSPDFQEVYKLYYILDNKTFFIVIGIYYNNEVAQYGSILTLSEIIDELSKLHNNAEYVRLEKIR